MNITFKFRLLQYYSGQKSEQGSVWILLLFGVLVLGTLFVLFLPSLLSCTNKAYQAEARNTIMQMNRKQQEFILENDAFAKSIPALKTDIEEMTEHYTYSITTNNNAAFNYAVKRKDSNKKHLKSYIAAVFNDPKNKDKDGHVILVTIICENNTPGSIYPPQPTIKNGVPSCSQGTTELTNK
ncbi:MAG TPA: type IV pilin-like G/H family protein [Nostocaceae cyanobacterium]|nr:type IV pilin-like G/H family protein [Nostocaceae cyanobacterium]